MRYNIPKFFEWSKMRADGYRPSIVVRFKQKTSLKRIRDLVDCMDANSGKIMLVNLMANLKIAVVAVPKGEEYGWCLGFLNFKEVCSAHPNIRRWRPRRRT